MLSQPLYEVLCKKLEFQVCKVYKKFCFDLYHFTVYHIIEFFKKMESLPSFVVKETTFLSLTSKITSPASSWKEKKTLKLHTFTFILSWKL